jgi:hypothetical protein
LEAFAPFEKCESVIYIVFKVLRVEIRVGRHSRDNNHLCGNILHVINDRKVSQQGRDPDPSDNPNRFGN